MKIRLDALMVKRGLVKSRDRATALIMQGSVLVGGMPVAKAGTQVDASAQIELKDKDIPFVSRGGLKLESALENFKINLSGLTVMDVGASTGGFTDCMLKQGAIKAYCIDVGYGQFDWSLRNDKRVILMERTNIRHLRADAIPVAIDFAAIDVSFISLRLVLPKVFELLAQDGRVVALVKPQFEVGKADVGKGGIVRDEQKRLDSVERVTQSALEIGFQSEGMIESPIKGQKGNVEYLLCLRKRD